MCPICIASAAATAVSGSFGICLAEVLVTQRKLFKSWVSRKPIRRAIPRSNAS
jgi:hypothetical protein